MAGNYLKSLQLAKQLEERAREATKNKERAEQAYVELERFVETCRDSDADLSEVEKILGDYNAAFDSKDYQSALAYVSKASDEARSSFIKRIGEVADSAEELLNLAQIPASEAKGALELLEKSKDQVLKDDLEGAMKSAKSAYGAAERALHEYFSTLISQAQEVLIQAKDMGDEVGVFEELLRKGKSALDKQEYETGISHVKEALEGAGENVRVQVKATIDRAEEFMVAGEELKADLTKAKAHIERANGALESLRYKDALAYAKRAESEGENTIHSKLQDLSREVREGIRKLKAVDEEIGIPQDLLDQAQAAMKDKKYIEAMRALSVADERVTEMQFKSVLDVIAKAKDRFVLAKKVGVDMTKPIMLLNTARDNLRLGKFEDSVKYAEQSRTEIEAALSVFYGARDQLVELAKAIKFAEDIGGDVTAVKSVLGEAKKAFESKDYQKTPELAAQAIGDAKKAAYDKTMDTIDVADKAFKVGKSMGADVTEAEGLLQRALASFSKEDLPESVKLARSGLEAANDAMTRVLSDRIHNIDQFVKGFTGEESLADVAEVINEARLRLSELSFETAFELLKDAQQRIEKTGQEECERLLGTATTKVEALKALDGEVADLEILITRVKEAMTKGVYEDATARAKEVIAGADELMLKLVQAQFSGMKDSIDEAKSIGIDVEAARATVKEARARFEAKDLEGAYSLLHGTRASLRKKVERFDDIKEMIRTAEELISEAQRSKANVASQVEELEAAKSVFKAGDFDSAEKALADLTREAEKKLAMYLAAKFILTSKEGIELVEANGVDVSEGQEMLAKAKDLMKAKEYEEALETAKNCSEAVSGTIAKAAGAMIKDLHRLLTDAKNVGIDTAGPEMLAQKADSLLKTGDYPEALRCIESARTDIDQIKNLSSQAAVEIKVARTSLKDAESLDMDVGKSREFLDQAVEALTRHQYAIALELAKKSSQTSSEITRNTIWGTLEKFRGKIDKSISEGGSVGMAERYVAEGVTAFNDGRYQEALRLAMQCEAEMDRAELQREVGSKAVEMAMMKAKEAAREGIKSEIVTTLVGNAEELLSKGKYVEALEEALKSGDELHRIRENLDSVRIELSSIREQVDRLRKVGIDTSECDQMVRAVNTMLTDHEFPEAREEMRRCSERAMALFEDSINDVMQQNGELISRAKSMGLSTKSCEDLMEVAKTSFSEKLWDFAYQQAAACRTMCFEVISKKIGNLSSDAMARLEPLKAVGASVKSVEELIEGAKEAVGRGDAPEAFQLLMEADQRILGIEDSHRKFTDLSIAAESAVEVLRRLDISTAESERLLALADLEREKDYDSAIEFIVEVLDSAKATIESYAPEVTGCVGSSSLQEGAEGEMNITLKNTGNVPAKDVSLELSGQFKVVDIPEVGNLRPGAGTTVKARIIPDRSGDLTVRVNIACKRTFDGAPRTFEFDGSVNVFKSGPPFKVTRATEMAKCAFCQGRIKNGFDIVSCRCGSDLHLACAKRTGKCPVCQQKYSF